MTVVPLLKQEVEGLSKDSNVLVVIGKEKDIQKIK
jgi:hypothetical protein